MCRHYFHDSIMHSFPDIEEMSFFDNGGIVYIQGRSTIFRMPIYPMLNQCQ